MRKPAKWTAGIVAALLVALFCGLSYMAGSPKDVYGMVRYAFPHMRRGTLNELALVRLCSCLEVLLDHPSGARSAMSSSCITTTRSTSIFSPCTCAKLIPQTNGK